MTLSVDTFQQHYIELVNDDDMHVHYTHCCDAGMTSADDVKRYIIGTPNFANRLHAVLNRVVPAVATNLPVTRDLVNSCIEHCHKVLRFSIKDISEFVESLVPEPQPIQEQYEPEPKAEPDINANVRGFVKAYEKHINRPMYAMELLVLSHHATTDDDAVQTLALNVRKAYDATCDLVVKYQGRHISEHDFVTYWLDKVLPVDDISDRIERLRRALLGSEQYQTVMKQRIASKYTSLFGNAASNDDVEYFFRQIVVTEMHLLDDGMDQLLVDLYREKKADIEEITLVYEDTYNRTPDRSELEQALRDYRQPRDDYTISNENLRRILCADLEYHDVVKHKIIDAFAQEHPGETLTTRSMYSILKQVLRAVPLLHDTDALENVIQRVIEQIELSDDTPRGPE